ncbi:peptidoglycan-recognition protein LD isoform X1 [Drosophila rhopaloa]|nr:peptidoglycan-recognition protein LD isoform X1 [Drosophila rhopaloa]
MPDFGYRLSLIEHDIWSEMDLQGQGTPLDPLKAVLFTHTESEECNEDCPEVLRKLQSSSLEELPYNFLVTGDCQVFKVYGWEYESNFLKDLSGNSSLVIAFVGNFSRNPPKDCQLKAAQALILESVKRKKLQPEYKLFVLANNAEALQRELMHWPRYTSPRRMK